MTEPVAAVVLAAGFGTRLAPLSDQVPKPLLEVGGAPVATHLVQGLRSLPHLTTIVVVINERHPDQFATWRRGLPDPEQILVVNTGARVEAERNGAVADLQAAMARLPDHTGRWIVVAGDNFVDTEDLRALDAVGRAGRDAVLCRDVGIETAGAFGEVTVDAEDKVVMFREKPPDRQSPIAATCTYALGVGTAEHLKAYLADGGDADAPGRFIAWLSTTGAVYAQILRGRYHDIGTHENLAAARSALDELYARRGEGDPRSG